MSRSEIRAGHDVEEVGAAIIATWYKVLPSDIPIVAATKAAQATIRTDWPAFAMGDSIYISGVEGMTDLNRRSFKVGNVAADGTVALLDPSTNNPIDSRAFGTYTRGGRAVSEAIGDLQSPALRNELSFALKQIVNVDVEVVADSASKIYVILPKLPEGVRSRQDLLEYLRDYHKHSQNRHYHEELGTAVLFGCGK